MSHQAPNLLKGRTQSENVYKSTLFTIVEQSQQVGGHQRETKEYNNQLNHNQQKATTKNYHDHATKNTEIDQQNQTGSQPLTNSSETKFKTQTQPRTSEQTPDTKQNHNDYSSKPLLSSKDLTTSVDQTTQVVLLSANDDDNTQIMQTESIQQLATTLENVSINDKLSIGSQSISSNSNHQHQHQNQNQQLMIEGMVSMPQQCHQKSHQNTATVGTTTFGENRGDVAEQTSQSSSRSPDKLHRIVAEQKQSSAVSHGSHLAASSSAKQHFFVSQSSKGSSSKQEDCDEGSTNMNYSRQQQLLQQPTPNNFVNQTHTHNTHTHSNQNGHHTTSFNKQERSRFEENKPKGQQKFRKVCSDARMTHNQPTHQQMVVTTHTHQNHHHTNDHSSGSFVGVIGNGSNDRGGRAVNSNQLHTNMHQPKSIGNISYARKGGGPRSMRGGDSSCDQQSTMRNTAGGTTTTSGTNHSNSVYSNSNQMQNTNVNGGSLTNFEAGVPLLDLRLFKTEPCTHMNRHNQKKCCFYHEKDRRRPLGTYSSEMCPHVEHNGTCPAGDSCHRAHNRVEDFYHPEKYKSKFCNKWPGKVDECEFGNLCAFAHSEEELSIDMLHKMEPDADFYMFYFKTVWCPFNDKSKSHQRDECQYAHNWQDYRRKPHLYEYEGKEQCKFWSTKEETKTYSDGCELEYRCRNCHGWKEKEYHCDNFRVNECEAGPACHKIHCPYWHTERQRRTPLPQFRLFPRNRGTQTSQTVVYAGNFLATMFSEPTRVDRVQHFRKAANQTYPSQQIYGCGPQSTPVLDPNLVLCFQRALLEAQFGSTFQLAINGTKFQPNSQQQTQNQNQQPHLISNSSNPSAKQGATPLSKQSSSSVGSHSTTNQTNQHQDNQNYYNSQGYTMYHHPSSSSQYQSHKFNNSVSSTTYSGLQITNSQNQQFQQSQSQNQNVQSFNTTQQNQNNQQYTTPPPPSFYQMQPDMQRVFAKYSPQNSSHIMMQSQQINGQNSVQQMSSQNGQSLFSHQPSSHQQSWSQASAQTQSSFQPQNHQKSPFEQNQNDQSRLYNANFSNFVPQMPLAPQQNLQANSSGGDQTYNSAKSGSQMQTEMVQAYFQNQVRESGSSGGVFQQFGQSAQNQPQFEKTSSQLLQFQNAGQSHQSEKNLNYGTSQDGRQSKKQPKTAHLPFNDSPNLQESAASQRTLSENSLLVHDSDQGLTPPSRTGSESTFASQNQMVNNGIPYTVQPVRIPTNVSHGFTQEDPNSLQSSPTTLNQRHHRNNQGSTTTNLSNTPKNVTTNDSSNHNLQENSSLFGPYVSMKVPYFSEERLGLSTATAGTGIQHSDVSDVKSAAESTHLRNFLAKHNLNVFGEIFTKVRNSRALSQALLSETSANFTNDETSDNNAMTLSQTSTTNLPSFEFVLTLESLQKCSDNQIYAFFSRQDIYCEILSEQEQAATAKGTTMQQISRPHLEQILQLIFALRQTNNEAALTSNKTQNNNNSSQNNQL